MTAEIIEFPQHGAHDAAGPTVQPSSQDSQTGDACEVGKPQAAVLSTSQVSRTWTDDELDGVRIDVGMHWDTFKFEVCKDSPLHAKLYALLGQ